MNPKTEADHVVDDYVRSTTRSAALYQRAQSVLPGGNSRATVDYEPYPFYFDHGEGSQVVDVDGVRRLDFINNYTSLIHGHGHPSVVGAVTAQLQRGFSSAAPTELEIALAEELQRRVPSLELLRFTASGTEATMLALRAARAYTGRARIAKFAGSYHGSHDYGAAQSGSADPRQAGSQSVTAGIPDVVAATTLLLPFNETEQAVQLLEEHGDELAAVIIEPVLGSGGIIPAKPEFLQALRATTTALGIVLIFDEIISFRVGYGGAQGLYGVTPDLTTLGKIVGGGLPAAAFGGRGEIMELFAPRRASSYILHGGTHNGNLVSLAAGLATLHLLDEAAFAHLDKLGAQLKAQLTGLFKAQGHSLQVNQIGSLFNLHATTEPVDTYAKAQAGDRRLISALYLAALNHGVVFTARGMGCVSTVMGDDELESFVEAIAAGLADIRATAEVSR